ncbi:MAG: T9SS type A sorting domain-containing protein [Saprospiraceae bacterium]|nr:T9SS type A sorting domain-containing protein [Saprospiraceae bacterium]
MKLKYLLLFIYSSVLLNIGISQNTYCLNISTTDNGSSVTFDWSLSASQVVAASIEVIGTGDLNGNSEIIGGFGQSSYSGSFDWSKSLSGIITFTIDDSAPLGVVLPSPPNTRFSPDCSIAPITLSTFLATKYTDKSSKLEWSTLSEFNSEYFGIERSNDGASWETIGKVAAAGNSNKELHYTLIDDRLPFMRSNEQLFYYRLRLTDLDGTFKYSDIKGVNFNRLYTSKVNIFPNPTLDRINVDLSGLDPESGNSEISMFDMTGQLILRKKVAGNGIELIDTQNLSPNTYNVVIRQGKRIYQQRVIKL